MTTSPAYHVHSEARGPHWIAWLTRDGSPIAGIEELEEYDLSLAGQRPEAVLISAERGWGLDDLLGRIDDSLRRAEHARVPAPVRKSS